MNGNGVQRVCPLPSAQSVCRNTLCFLILVLSVPPPHACVTLCVCVYTWGLKMPAGLGLNVTASLCRTLSLYECQGVTCSGHPCLSVCIRLCVVPSGLVNHFCVWACSCLSLGLSVSLCH